MSIAKNYIYNMCYQVVIMLFPIITIPYVTRVLGSHNLGIFAFTDSIIQYFILIGSIGIGLYASRHIAYFRDDIKKRSDTFWELFVMRTVLVALSLVVFYLFLYFYDVQYKKMYLIQSLNLVAYFFDLSWLFIALEDFKKILMRNLIVRGAGYAGLFLLIKTRDDLLLYAALIAVTNVVANFLMCIYIPQYVKKINIENIKNSFSHFKGCMGLFVPQVAIQVYTVLDKTMLGIFSIPSEVAYYDMSQKLARIVLAMVTTASLTLLPRISNCFAKQEFDKIRDYSGKSFQFVMYLSLPLMVGLIAISKDFVPWFFGSDFFKVTLLIKFTAFLLPLAAAGSVFGYQLMIPLKKENLYTLSLTAGAVINVILNLVLIPKIHSLGACIASVIAEFIIMLAQFYLMRAYLPIKNMFFELWKYVVSAILIFITVYPLGYCLPESIVTTFIQVMIGLIIYIFSQFVLKSNIQGIIISKLYFMYFKK